MCIVAKRKEEDNKTKTTLDIFQGRFLMEKVGFVVPLGISDFVILLRRRWYRWNCEKLPTHQKCIPSQSLSPWKLPAQGSRSSQVLPMRYRQKWMRA